MFTFKQFIIESNQAIPLNTSKWKKIGNQRGSNPGGKYEDDTGNQWYVKQSHTDDHAKNEHFAHLLYKAAGSPVNDYNLITHTDNRLGVASKWIDNAQKFNRNNPEHVKAAQQHFATHAWTANWDSIGLDYDNQVITPKGMTTIDTGGSLIYRAMGGPKGHLWNDRADEFESLRDPNRGEQAHAVFGSMSNADLKKSVHDRLGHLKDDHIRDLAMMHAPGNDEDKRRMGEILVARRNALLNKVKQF